MNEMNLFAYGTLMDGGIMARVSGMRCRAATAVLCGFLRRTVRGEVYPAIVARPAETVEGVVYFDLSPEAFDRLDRFEGPMYRRTAVDVVLKEGGKKAAAETYVIVPEFEDRLSERGWSFERFRRNGRAEFEKNYSGYEKLE
jgi:gamma-glutamylcyclotransferase (GGCT)/AIG2-like uncharacterized protein YtfP